MVRIQIVSDTHLEFCANQYPHIRRCAPILALLGDVGAPFSALYRRFIADVSRRFDHVLLLAGNHEYQTIRKHRKRPVAEIRAEIERVAALHANVHFLNNTKIFIDGVRILGCTLWTRIPAELWRSARREMTDYKRTFIDVYHGDVGVPLSPEHTTYWHEESVAWLREELAAPAHANTPTIILSHHCPYTVGTSDPKYKENGLQCCYSTDLSSFFVAPIVAWAYGHTHYTADFVVNNVRLLSNPLGYPNELGNEHERRATKYPPIIECESNNDNSARRRTQSPCQ